MLTDRRQNTSGQSSVIELTFVVDDSNDSGKGNGSVILNDQQEIVTSDRQSEPVRTVEPQTDDGDHDRSTLSRSSKGQQQQRTGQTSTDRKSARRPVWFDQNLQHENDQKRRSIKSRLPISVDSKEPPRFDSTFDGGRCPTIDRSIPPFTDRKCFGRDRPDVCRTMPRVRPRHADAFEHQSLGYATYDRYRSAFPYSTMYRSPPVYQPPHQSHCYYCTYDWRSVGGVHFAYWPRTGLISSSTSSSNQHRMSTCDLESRSCYICGSYLINRDRPIRTSATAWAAAATTIDNAGCPTSIPSTHSIPETNEVRSTSRPCSKRSCLFLWMLILTLAVIMALAIGLIVQISYESSRFDVQQSTIVTLSPDSDVRSEQSFTSFRKR